VTRGNRTVLTIVASFAAGVAFDSWLRVYGPPQPATSTTAARETGEPRESREPREPRERSEPREPREPSEPREPVSVGTTGRTRLRMPIEGVDVESIKGGFDEPRTGHPHEAVDILSPRNTPIHAVEAGTIAKLFTSKAGGLTIYQFDPSQRLCYYYAHLERYAPGLREGDAVNQGDVIGYVGTSGNAPKNTPHLHFAIFKLGADKRWWQGTPIDPYQVFKRRR
jgi:murein DD-endopeptidase MepM/ murein hydrolase activator NlpD